MQGDSRAADRLFRGFEGALKRWAHGRVPRWARRLDETSDLVQEVLLRTFARLDRIENRGRGALGAYLRKAVDNRVKEISRSAANRRTDSLGDRRADQVATGPSPFDAAGDAEAERLYREALDSLTEDERLLVVGRLECDYSYDQLALVSGRPSPGAARLAVRRATEKLTRLIAERDAPHGTQGQ
jgi:RNA polymerase sigma-70 factor (ECF subfamily)